MYMKYPNVCFRPTQEMYELIQNTKRKTGLDTSEVMRTIVSEYMMLVKKHIKNYK